MTSDGYPTPGDRIGAYRVLRRIGSGGMGMVFAATHEGLDRDVALKVIAPHLADDDAFRARFTSEARALAALDSPHVVHVYDHGEHDGHLYIATQLVPDGDLGSMLRARGAPPVRTAVDLMAQVAEGLSDAHQAGIVHRDIKPANVLVRESGGRVTAYLGDFGIARQVDAEHTPTSRTIGTPSYMAPELHTGGKAGVSTDVYSLGCLLWATLTGKAPYAGTSDYEIVHAHVESPVPQLPASGPLVDGVNAILRTAMAKDPAERPQTAAAVRDELRAALGLPDPSPSSGTRHRRSRAADARDCSPPWRSSWLSSSSADGCCSAGTSPRHRSPIRVR
ncbi:MAG: serine/threonine-protein kinase [Nocardioides sp.]